MGIIEFIDSVLPQDKVDIYYLALPQNSFGMLIEETGTRGVINSFDGYDGVTSSRIQFYAKVKPTDGMYREMNGLLKSFYKEVQNSKGLTKENIKLLWVGEFSLVSNMRDEHNNYIFSLDFPIIYKE